MGVCVTEGVTVLVEEGVGVGVTFGNGAGAGVTVTTGSGAGVRVTAGIDVNVGATVTEGAGEGLTGPLHALRSTASKITDMSKNRFKVSPPFA